MTTGRVAPWAMDSVLTQPREKKKEKRGRGAQSYGKGADGGGILKKRKKKVEYIQGICKVRLGGGGGGGGGASFSCDQCLFFLRIPVFVPPKK